MQDGQMTGGLVQMWMTVTDEGGSTRLESRWTSAAPAVAHAA